MAAQVLAAPKLPRAEPAWWDVDLGPHCLTGLGKMEKGVEDSKGGSGV